MCVHCAVTTMSERAPTINDTIVRQPVDNEAVSCAADTAGRLIGAPHVCTHGGGWWFQNQLVWPGAVIRTHV